jgi:hypothetical protein
MKREWILVLAFFLVVGGGFAVITVSITKAFVNSMNSAAANYFPEGNGGIGE